MYQAAPTQLAVESLVSAADYPAMLIQLLPEIFVAVMAAFILIVGVYNKRSKQNICYILSLLTLAIAIILTLAAMPVVSHTIFDGAFVVDRFGSVLKLLLFVLLGMIFIYSKRYISDRDFFTAEFFALSLYSLLGMMVLISCAEFLTMFLGLELLVLPLYAMIVMVKKKPNYTEAAMKYFVLGSLGAGILLYGISFVFGATGSFKFAAIGVSGADQYMLQLGMIMVLAGVALEFGAVPLHMWLPDVYEGSPTAVTMLIGTLPKIAIFAVAYRLLSVAFPDSNAYWQQMLLILSVLSIILGNLVALVQTNIKRMLAYSTIGHIGFILLGLFVAPQQGYLAPLVYTVVYAFMVLAAFAVIMRLTDQGFEADTIHDFRGLNGKNPWLAFLMLLIMFSLAGIPPLVGFYAKLLVLQSVVAAGYSWLAIMALVFSVIGAYYYLRIIKAMYFDVPLINSVPVSVNAMTGVANSLVVINALMLLFLGVFPSYVLRLCISMLS